MQSLEQQWERIRVQTSWKLECCHKPASSEVRPANDNNPGVSTFFFSSEVADKHSMWGEHPGKHLDIMYFYARSLCPKIDELRVLCDMEKPDIVCMHVTKSMTRNAPFLGTTVTGVTGTDMVVCKGYVEFS